MAGPAGGSGVTVAALTQSPTIAAPLTAEGVITSYSIHYTKLYEEGSDRPKIHVLLDWPSMLEPR